MPHPLHPTLVHFPIALIITALIFHLLYLLSPKIISAKIALTQLIMGVIGAFISAWSGEKAMQDAQPFASSEIEGIVEQHELWANLTIWSGLILLISLIYIKLKYKNRRLTDRVMLVGMIMLTIFVIRTAFFGAELVFKYHVFIPIK